MGCGGSKSDDLPLVIRCRERKEFIKAAADHRYALAAAHVAYFRSLTGVGDALRRFVDEELVLVSPSASPVLTLPSDEGKTPSSKNKSNNRSINHNHSSSSPTTLSHSGSGSHIQLSDDDDDHEHHHNGDGSHLNLSSDSDSDPGSSSGHIHEHSTSGGAEVGGPSFSSQPPQTDWGSYSMNPPSREPLYSNLPPQTNWGSYGGMNQPHEEPQYVSQPPQSGWGSYGMNQPPQTAWGSYGAYPPPQSGWAPYGGGSSPPYSAWNQYGTNTTTHTYYMKRSSPQVQSVIYDPTESQTMGQVPESSYSYVNSYQNYPPYESGGGFFGYPMRSPPRQPAQNQKPSPPKGPPPPPSPKASSWDFLNPFEGYDSGYPGYFSHSNRYDAGSIASSPDSNEVREREGIPDLEDETETETYRDIRKGKNLYEDARKNSGEGTSRAVPSQKQSSNEGSSRTGRPHKQQDSEGSSRTGRPHKQQDSEGSSRTGLPHKQQDSEGTLSSEADSIEDITSNFPSENSEGTSRKVPSQNSTHTHSVHVKETESSSDGIVSKSAEEESSRKKGVTFEVDSVSIQEPESSKLSSLTTFSVHGTRDLQEVVAEIRDEFAMASSYGKEVAMLLEVGKLPYAPKFTLLKVILSRILGTSAPSLSSSPSTSRRSVKLAYRTMKLAKSYYGENWKSSQVQPIDLSSTLEKLYVWEKRLYKEIKDEERLRVLYEKMCNRLKHLDDQGAETSKIEATQESIRKLLTKLKVCIKAVDAISGRIHKLRDEELQPQVTELIYGLIRMWKTMLRCHQKQFQAIMESKMRSLRANTSSGSLKATLELEAELRAWSGHFVDWIKSQKSFITSLNEWLLRCIFHEPEETPDGPVPFSPGRIGAPPVFVICHDWSQAMGNISEEGVAAAMSNFASSLLELLETQGEEQKQRLKAEFITKDFERRLKARRMERGRGDRDQEAMSDKTGGSLVASESGISPLDDLKVDLDSMRKRMEEERSRHKEAAKLVHTATSSSLQGGLVPIFEALGSFTSDALKAYEHVRVQGAGEPPQRE